MRDLAGQDVGRDDSFQKSETITYPLTPGSLVGVLRFVKRGADFRGQEIPSGIYTLRYADQPVDGNHVGTFETRDFLLMTPAKIDQSAAPVAEMDLFKNSAKAADSGHPAIMPLVQAEAGDVPGLRHLEDQDWWTARFAAKVPKGGDAATGKLPLELIVVARRRVRES